MLQFFTPENKIQKDRLLMRDTDSRLAKYSRRGLILNFIVFVLCLFFGEFAEKEFNTAIVLVTGLLLVTLVRSYYLFRFDTLYARAPARWRNQYFFASCLGAAWWSVILVTLTWVQGMRGETLVMWLYSVVFYSSVSNVFSPYRRFLTLYLGIGQLPAAITAIALGTVDGLMYGCIMLTFYLMLIYQGRMASIAYWERLETHVALRDRAQGLEVEKQHSQAQIQLKNEFLVSLGQEIRESIGDVMGTLARIDENQLSEHHRELLAAANKAAGRQVDLVNNIVDFSKITTRTLVLENVEFDLRRNLEKLVQDFSLDAHQQGIELYYSFDVNLPLRVKCDVARLNQILAALLHHTLKYSRLEHVFVEARFLQEQDDMGQLQVVISDNEKGASDSGARETVQKEIGVAISKGLAECMGGSIHVREHKHHGKYLIINIPIQVISHEEHRLGWEQKMRGKRILFVDLPDNNAHTLQEEVRSWGAEVSSVKGRDALLERLNSTVASGQMSDLIVIVSRLDNMNALALSQAVVSVPAYAATKQIIAMSILQSDTPEMRQHVRAHPHITVIEKPIMRKRLYDVALHKLFGTGLEQSASIERRLLSVDSPRALLISGQRVDQMVTSAMLKKMGCYVQTVETMSAAIEGIAQESFDVVLIEQDASDALDEHALHKFRHHIEQHASRYVPMVAIASHHPDGAVDPVVEELDDVIYKPLRYDEMVDRLTVWLDPSSQGKRIV
jgi:signal transduction histidine kinase/CheY-like chemotaxis protein